MYEPYVSDDSILLDAECKRMLRRNSRQKIIKDVVQKLSHIKTIYKIDNERCEFNHESNNFKRTNITIYEALLIFLGCNKNIN